MRSRLMRLAPVLLVGGVFAGFAGAYGVAPLFTDRSYAVSALVQDEEVPITTLEPFVPSTTTPIRIIDRLTIPDAVPTKGKLIAADLKDMRLWLYEDGAEVAEYPILTKGRPGTPYETPAGFYQVLTKEVDHLNAGEGVHMPYSMQFYGNYFIHGWPYYEDGTPVESNFSGGCIRMSTSDAEKVYDFAKKGTSIFVYDPEGLPPPTLALDNTSVPAVSAATYLVADLDTGDVYAERAAQESRSIASLAKLMTALVANETIMFNKKIPVTPAEIDPAAGEGRESFTVGDLIYPLLMQSNDAVATRLARYYGTANFVKWMNTAAKALDMSSTHFADASGNGTENVSVADDLYRLAVYLADKKSFILKVTRTPEKEIVAASGTTYRLSNPDVVASPPGFVGGKAGQTSLAEGAMASVFSVPVADTTRRVAVIVLGSADEKSDTAALAEWFAGSAARGAALSAAACAGCTSAPHYRKIGL